MTNIGDSTESSNSTDASHADTATATTTDYACSWSPADCSSHRNSEEPDKRALERQKEHGLPAAARRAPGRLIEGSVTTNWKAALAQLALVYPDRIDPHL